MAKKLSKSTISELMAWWGRKGGSRATQKQKNAARDNLRKTPNYQKRTGLQCEISAVCGRRSVVHATLDK
jgi:hypothetical protein